MVVLTCLPPDWIERGGSIWIFCGKLQWHKWKCLITTHHYAGNSTAMSTSKNNIINSFRKGLAKLMETDQSGAIKHGSLRCTFFCQKWTRCPKGKIILWIFHSLSCFLIICHWPLLETGHKVQSIFYPSQEDTFAVSLKFKISMVENTVCAKGRETAELLAPKWARKVIFCMECSK